MGPLSNHISIYPFSVRKRVLIKRYIALIFVLPTNFMPFTKVKVSTEIQISFPHDRCQLFAHAKHYRGRFLVLDLEFAT